MNPMRRRLIRGFTLVEVMVTALIFLILIGSVLTILAIGQSSWETGDVRVELEQELRKSMSWLSSDLRSAGVTTVTDVPADGAWYTSVTFRKPSDVANGMIVWETDTIQYVCGGAGGRQLLRKTAGSARVVANNIISFQARRMSSNPRMLEVRVSADKRTFKGRLLTDALDLRFNLRN